MKIIDRIVAGLLMLVLLAGLFGAFVPVERPTAKSEIQESNVVLAIWNLIKMTTVTKQRPDDDNKPG